MKMGDRELTAGGHLDAVFHGRNDVPVKLTVRGMLSNLVAGGSIRSRFNPWVMICCPLVYNVPPCQSLCPTVDHSH